MCTKIFEDKLENILREAHIPYRRQPSIGGLRPDFIVTGPHGEKILLEVKMWDPRGGNTARAFRQVQLYKKATGADQALIVMPDLKKNYKRRVSLSLRWSCLRFKKCSNCRRKANLPSRLLPAKNPVRRRRPKV
jgi:hypothetical protein